VLKIALKFQHFAEYFSIDFSKFQVTVPATDRPDNKLT